MKRDKFTWINKHSDETLTKERIMDRVMANPKLTELYTGRSLKVMASRCSDH